MSRISSAAVGLLVSLGAASIAAAQSTAPTTPAAPTAPAARPGTQDKHALFKDLGLTAAQKAQAKAIRQKYHSQGKAGRAQEMTEIRALLTPEQQTRFDARRASTKGKGGGHGRKGHGGHRRGPTNP